MSNVQIPNLPAVVAVAGPELVEAVQSGTSVKVSLEQIAAYIQGAINSGITLLNTNSPITGGPITTTGTIGIASKGIDNSILANMQNSRVKANISGATNSPSDVIITDLLDYTIGSSQGMIARRNASNWAGLAIGTSGQVLTSNGTTAVWADAAVATVATFTTRAAAVTWIASNTPPDGSIIAANGIFYRRSTGATTISDMLGWVPNGQPYLDHWPVTVAGLQAAVTYCQNGRLMVRSSASYSATSSTVISGCNNITIEGTDPNAVTISFSGNLSYFTLFRGNGATFVNIGINISMSVDGSAAVFFHNTIGTVQFNNCRIVGNPVFGTTSYVRSFYVVQVNSSGSCGIINIINNYISGFSYGVIKSNASTATVIGCTMDRNYFTGCTKEPAGINSPLGSVGYFICTDNVLVAHTAGTVGIDGHYIGCAGCEKVVISGNVMEGFCREAIHVENAAKRVVISNNVMKMDFTGIDSCAMISVFNGLDGAGIMPEDIVINGNVGYQSGTYSSVNTSVGIWVYDFISGYETQSAKYCSVSNNVMRNLYIGYDIFGDGSNGIKANDNIAAECYVGYNIRHEANRIINGNVSASCVYGLRAQTSGAVLDHTFSNCTNTLCHSIPSTSGFVAINDITSVAPNRDFVTPSSYDYVIITGVKSTAKIRAQVTVSVAAQLSSEMNGFYDVPIVWDGVTLFSGSAISSVSGGTISISVSGEKIIATVTSIAVASGVRFSAKISGMAYIASVGGV